MSASTPVFPCVPPLRINELLVELLALPCAIKPQHLSQNRRFVAVGTQLQPQSCRDTVYKHSKAAGNEMQESNENIVSHVWFATE